MAKLSDFRVDTRAISDGAWVRVDEARFGDLEILTKGFGDEFVDAQTARLEAAAEKYDGDVSRIPNAIRREINAGLLQDFLVLGVRNLEGDDGKPVGITEFHAMLGDAAYKKLAVASWKAAGKVSTRSAAQAEAAEGN